MRASIAYGHLVLTVRVIKAFGGPYFLTMANEFWRFSLMSLVHPVNEARMTYLPLSAGVRSLSKPARHWPSGCKALLASNSGEAETI